MLTKIDHIGIAVKELRKVIDTYKRGFNLEPKFTEAITDQSVRVAGFAIGNNIIEYIEPLSDDSPISKFLKKHGSGIHHIAYQVEDIEESLKKLKMEGFRLIDESPRIGAEGKKIAFLHPESFNGILIELCEIMD